MKKITDERQEYEFMKVEHIGFWVMFWALAADILIKILFFNLGFRQTIGEYLVFLSGCTITAIGYLRKGLWSYHSAPSIKNYLAVSTISGMLASLILGIVKKSQGYHHVLWISLIPGLIVFALVFLLLFITGTYCKKRQDQLERKYQDGDEE